MSALGLDRGDVDEGEEIREKIQHDTRKYDIGEEKLGYFPFVIKWAS